MTYGSAVTVPGSFATTLEAVRAALAEQGFGVLTEIDVAATMKAKLDVDLEPYVILGACNPPLAYRAIQADASIGLLLPCNVVVRQVGEKNIVEAIDPMMMVDLSSAPEMQAVAVEAATRLGAALASLNS